MIAVVIGVDRDRLRRLRLERGFTQIELAQEAGVSPDTIVRWERGLGKNPHASSLRKLARALGVEIAELLEG